MPCGIQLSQGIFIINHFLQTEPKKQLSIEKIYLIFLETCHLNYFHSS